MIQRRPLRLLLAAIAAAALSNAAIAATFRGLGALPGGRNESYAWVLSADGSVVVGESKAVVGFSWDAFRWTESDGMVSLGDLPGGSSLPYSQGRGVSADGSVVVGRGSSDASGSNDSLTGGYRYEAFRWTASSGMVGLGDLPGGIFDSYASAVSFDGSVVVGYGSSPSGWEAFRWTAETGMVGLGDLPGGRASSTAQGISADGSVIVGRGSSAESDYLYEAFRWTAGGGMVGLGDLPGGDFNSEAYDVSADGSVVVGYSSSASSRYEAFRWTAEGGMVGLGDLPGGDFNSEALCVSTDGSIVAGRGRSSVGTEAFLWTQSLGMRSIASLLGSSVPAGWRLWYVSGIVVNNGIVTVVGTGQNPAGKPEAYMASLAVPEPHGLLPLTSGLLLTFASAIRRRGGGCSRWRRRVSERATSIQGTCD